MATTKTSATAVSALLRRLSYKPLPAERARQWGGVSVHRGFLPTMSAVINVHDGENHEVDAFETLKKLRAELDRQGYVTEPVRGDQSFATLYVTGRTVRPAGKPSPAPRPRDRARWAQDLIMNELARTVGYWAEDDRFAELSNSERTEMELELRKQADRVARLFGFDKAWVA